MGEGRAGRASGAQTRRQDFIQWMSRRAATYTNESKKPLARGRGVHFYMTESRSVFWKGARRCRRWVMTISSDSSSVLSGEECEKGLPLLLPTELLLRHVIWTSQVSPRAAGSEPSFPGSRMTSPAPVPTRAFPRSCPMPAHQSTGVSAVGQPRKNQKPTPLPLMKARREAV